MMRSGLENGATAAVVAASVLIAAASIHREFINHRPKGTLEFQADRPPAYQSNWRDLLAAGVLVGDSDAKVKIIEFADLECPFCRQFHSAFLRAKTQFGRNVALVFVHYPLPMHRFARLAARAAECANAQGKFAEFQDAVYEKQDSLGLKAWTAFAVDAGIPDTATFARCSVETKRVPRVEAGLALGSKLEVHATPTVIINGWRFPMPPYDSLPAVIAAVVASRGAFALPGRDRTR